MLDGERYQPSHNCPDGWGVVVRFLIWLRGSYGEQLIFDLDERLRSGQYGDDTFWPSQTGKTMDVLWGKFAAGPHERLSDE